MPTRNTDNPGATDPHWLEHRDNRGRTHFGRRPSRTEWRRDQLIKDWYGPERGRMEILNGQRSPQPVANVIKDVLSNLGQRDIFVLDDLTTNWPAIVGADVAAHTRPAALSRRTLNIEVTDAAWLYVLERERKADILAKVRRTAKNDVNAVRLMPPGRRSVGA